jgi:hypothetical protein
MSDTDLGDNGRCRASFKLRSIAMVKLALLFVTPQERPYG